MLRPQENGCDIGAYEQTYARMHKIYDRSGNLILLGVSYRGVPGETYHLEASEDLIQWVQVDSKAADVLGRVGFDPFHPPTPSARCFRVKLQ